MCDYATWDDGNASAWCSFVTPDGKSRQVAVEGYGSPRFEAGDVVEIAYWKGRPRTAVVVQDEENYRRTHLVAAIVCSVLAAFSCWPRSWPQRSRSFGSATRCPQFSETICALVSHLGRFVWI